MDKNNTQNYKEKNEERPDDYESDEESYNNINNNGYEKNTNNNTNFENLEECYFDILENIRNSNSTILDKCNINNFNKFVKNHNK